MIFSRQIHSGDKGNVGKGEEAEIEGIITKGDGNNGGTIQPNHKGTRG